MYMTFGLIETIWQIFHDNISQYMQYIKLNENYDIKNNKFLNDKNELIIRFSFKLRQKKKKTLSNQEKFLNTKTL